LKISKLSTSRKVDRKDKLESLGHKSWWDFSSNISFVIFFVNNQKKRSVAWFSCHNSCPKLPTFYPFLNNSQKLKVIHKVPKWSYFNRRLFLPIYLSIPTTNFLYTRDEFKATSKLMQTSMIGSLRLVFSVFGNENKRIDIETRKSW
jgi:hypothetical protein